jgi:hypothetical protein
VTLPFDAGAASDVDSGVVCTGTACDESCTESEDGETYVSTTNFTAVSNGYAGSTVETITLPDGGSSTCTYTYTEVKQ